MVNIHRHTSEKRKLLGVLNHYLARKEDLNLMGLRTSDDPLRIRVDKMQTRLPPLEVCRETCVDTEFIRQRKVLEQL